MTREEYREKLRGFNNSDKYRMELEVLIALLKICPDPPVKRVLDFGCGLGTAMKVLRPEHFESVYGYDIDEKLYDGDPFYFRTELFFRVDAVYFMHSFAHIPNIEEILTQLRAEFLNPRGRIVIVTPNKEWLDLAPKENYKPDPTVFKHYYSEELKTLLKEYGFSTIAEGQFGKPFVSESGAIVNERIFIVARKR